MREAEDAPAPQTLTRWGLDPGLSAIAARGAASRCRVRAGRSWRWRPSATRVLAVDAGLDLAVGLAGAAGEVADQPAALGAQALAGFVGGLALGLPRSSGGAAGLAATIDLLRHRLRVVGREELQGGLAHDRLVELGVARAEGGEAGARLAGLRAGLVELLVPPPRRSARGRARGGAPSRSRGPAP